MLQWLSAHYAEPLRVADAAGVCSFSASHFMRWFRQMTGQSFIAFLNEYRLNTAAEALRTTDETVLTIASRCGFGKSFLVLTGRSRRISACPPRDYRQKIGKALDSCGCMAYDVGSGFFRSEKLVNSNYYFIRYS